VRAGGDEFLLLLAEAGENALQALLERLQHDAVQAPCAFSLGWSLREGDESLSDTLARADAAMYERRRLARASRAGS
jgi:GGDEF domain-containing protein